MTLIIAAAGARSVWMLADRRLTFSNGTIRDDARKILSLDTLDGKALVGYAGLGLTAGGTEPSDWMSRTLNGVNAPLKGALLRIAEAAAEHMPRHIRGLNGAGRHEFLISAMHTADARLYRISLKIDSTQSLSAKPILTVHESSTVRPLNGRTLRPRIEFIGSGADTLRSTQLEGWKHRLKMFILAYEANRINGHAVAEYLADLSFQVSSITSDKSVSPDCIVCWKSNSESLSEAFAGGRRLRHLGAFTPFESLVPWIANGMDMAAILPIVCGPSFDFFRMTSEGRKTDPNYVEPEYFEDGDAMNRQLAQLPERPDPSLN